MSSRFVCVLGGLLVGAGASAQMKYALVPAGVSSGVPATVAILGMGIAGVIKRRRKQS